MAEQTCAPLVVAGDVRYHVRSRMPLFDALTAVRCGCTVEEVRAQLLSNGERHLQDKCQIFEQFAEVPEAIERSVEIASRCTFSLDEIQYEYPNAVVPEYRTAQEQLAHLAWKGASQRYPKGVPKTVCQLIDHELSLIAELGYESYFLTVFDIVRFARRRGILCQGRGSAANSAVCYCLGITSVDPARMKVLFERFVSRERQEAPDIDVDFEHHRREEVIQYIYKTYGRTRAAMTAEIISYRLRSAVRDLAKALGISLDRIDAVSSTIDVGDSVDDLPARLSEAGVDPVSDVGVRLVSLVNQLVGFPRHLGQHVGGMVITQGELCDLVPIQPAAMEGRTIIQWDKNDLDELGILKIDCLALGMLSCIRRAFDLIESSEGKKLNLATVPAEDPAVYEMVSRADTVGIFQIESRAQMSMLPRLKPACFYDLVIEVAIVRPGPIQGNMVHPYLRRRNREEPVTYPNKELREVLEKTLGVPIFQEQAMRLAVVAAGFSPGEADQLRRAMGAWRRPGVIEEFRQKLISGMLQRGLSQQFADQVFGQIRGFGEYGFP
ncbi:MAG: error-prone DNA polymerase, partial [Pirellulales bacterium]